MTTARRLAAEFFGTAFLLAAIVGSGIMGERLAGGQRRHCMACERHCNRSDAGDSDFDLWADLRRTF
jgi:hypothetical protein